MEFNRFIFPVPPPTYTANSLSQLLFYIPQKGDFRSYKYGANKAKTLLIPSDRVNKGMLQKLV